MECRTLEIMVISAKDLKDVNLFSKMDVYAVVMVAGDPRSTQKTPVDKEGGTSPKWNYPMKFTVNEDAAQQNRLTLHFQLKSDRILGDKDIGEVYVPLKELLDGTIDGKSERDVVIFGMGKPSGRKTTGMLSFSYKFGSGSKYAPPPSLPTYPPSHAVSYPAQDRYQLPFHNGQGYRNPPPLNPTPMVGYTSLDGYQLPHAVHGYGYPPPHAVQAYGFQPPHAAGYGYAPPPVQRPQEKKKFGLGSVSDLFTGMFILDKLADVLDPGAYDGFDAGLDDAGGFN